MSRAAGRVAALVRARRQDVPAGRAMLVALSGIDGAGKGWVARRAAGALEAAGARVAIVNVDGFLALPSERFDAERPAETFYRRAIRFGALFERLVNPLVRDRSVAVTVDFAEETADAYRPRLFEYRDVDVVLLEGVYLLRRDHRPRYDLAVWLDCTFETALVRALRRQQEGLPMDETIRAYREIYFPAQLVHLALDDPRASADAVVPNDPLLGARRERRATATATALTG